MNYSIKECDTITDPGVVSMPGISKERPLKQYVHLRVGKYCLSLRVIKREGAAGCQVWVKPGLFKSIDVDNKDVCIVGISKTQFKIDRLFKTAGGQIDLLGLLLISSGLIIQVSFLFGEGVYPFLSFPGETKRFLLGLGSSMSAFGVFVFAVRRLWFSND